MKTIALISGTLLLVASAVAQSQPVVAAGGVRNSASYAAPGFPNSAIAQGSIFSVFGDNLGPNTPELGFNFPLPTVTPTGNVSVSVTVNGATTKAIILYAGKTQINAVLPSSTPVGTGTLTVTVNGQTSPGVPIQVVASDFGIYTVNSAGTGTGIVTYADFSLVTAANSANPGETLILWGTGLGPVSGDEAGSALPGDQASVPVEVYVGGMTAALTYRGRSGCCSGLDQIAFVVPANIQGCAVPVAVKIGDKVSNFASMSVAATGRACTDATTGLTSADFTTLFGKPNASFGTVSLNRIAGFAGANGSPTTTDSGLARFSRFNFPANTSFSPALFNSVSFGACTVSNFLGQSANPLAGFSFSGLDAGSAITINGPSGTRALTPSPIGAGVYANTRLGDGTPGNYLDSGQYTISGAGGSDVGAFTSTATVPSALVWTNQNAIQSVNQTAGQLITWSGGDASGYVSIDGTSVSSASAQAAAGSFHCQARVSDGSFTIPPIVLLSLPSSAGTLSVGESITSATFKASGLDLGVVTASSASFKTVTYQIPGQSSAPPVANAGANQVVKIGQVVQLNGAASMDPGGNPLTYQFTLVTAPSGSTAVLNAPTAANPTFTADRAGTYVVQLIVNNGKVNSTPVTVTITTNSPSAPTANAGANQNVPLNSTVALTGNGIDLQGFPITFKWALTSKPTGSTATLSSATAANPTFVADRAGAYTAQLIVNNGFLDSAPSTVTITVGGGGTAPVANAGANQGNITAGATVSLDGSASTSSTGGQLTYTWSFVSRPGGSAATLTGANTVRPTFVADVAGTYVVQLVVNDGTQSSAPATVTITAGAASGPSITATGGTPQSAPAGTQFAAPLSVTVKDGSGTPVSGTVVTFAAPASGASGTFAGGVATAITNASGVAMSPAFTANATAGTYVVTASAPGISTPATFSLSNTTGTPASIAASSGTPQSAVINAAFAAPLVVIVKDAAGNPVSGATVTFTLPTSGASGAFAGLTTTATTNAQGLATSPVLTANGTAGSYSVTASVAGVATPATFSLTNSPVASSTGITVGNASVGQNLQTPVTITLPQPAGAGGVQVSVTSGDPSKLLLAARATDTGQPTVSATIGGGVATTTIYVQGLASSGTVTLTATAPNLTGTGTITLTPSGFVLSGPNANGAGFTSGVGTNIALTVTSARLDASMAFAEAQPLRAGFSAMVPLTSSSPSIGTVSPSSVSFTGGQSGTATAQFRGVVAGTTTLTAGVPTGFSAPAASLNMVIATVGSAGITAPNVSVGNNLEVNAGITLNGPAAAGGVAVTVMSSDASKVLLSTSPTAAGSASITLTVPAGQTRTPDFYVQALASSGSATYTATAPGLGSGTGTVTLTTSGIIISGPSAPGSPSFLTGTGSAASPISVYSVQVDPAGFLNIQAVHGGSSAVVTVSSSSPSVGTITSSPVTISGGSSSANTSFQPLSMGNTTLAVNVPAGFTAITQDTSVVAMVRTAGLGITDQITIGMNLETTGTVVLGQLAQGGQTVTLTSNDPKLLLSTSANTPGSSTITVTVPAGSNNTSYYLQALSSSGSATYTATAPGFASRTATVTYGPSGILLEGPFGPGITVSTTVASPASMLTAYTALLDAGGNLVGMQPLAGGLTATATLTTSVAAVGTLTPPQVTFTGGMASATAAFSPKAAGTTVVSLQTPAGYSPPAAIYNTVNVTVK